MDKIKDLAGKLGNKSNNDTAGSSSGGNNNEDYLDKALDSAERKFGGGKVDPAKMRDTNEKITDGARTQFESMTGKKVPEKFSN
ncbi:hypothetical protein ASPZODRAFT_18637 [Penicilliopsis zonata CBS 506.65]|uniref:Uncharacterized protein n=1 Tax=Penicilliopsis zonata CBS 506.65 TaxID=1073090 RepID=A0A1L9SBC9_9EURO|nr:hypothetical protein ASPZODRAFT_18637 [Penicilliopsis zonata CBS 506.65]OJJ44446.1 hypothetical protein ASPZODRAFT_18637 [Penicilliopsis zonata CBS 506.65]